MNKPYVIMSVAMSLDGIIGTEDRTPIQFSNKKDTDAVDKIRSECDAILVGSTTLLNDNPSLLIKNPAYSAVRKKEGKMLHPLKVAISKDCMIDQDCKFLKGDTKKIIFTTKLASKDHIKELEKNNSSLQIIQNNDSLVLINEVLSKLYKQGVKKLLVEGGSQTNTMFLEAGVVDELRIAIAPLILGLRKAPHMNAALFKHLTLSLKKTEQLDDMTVIHYLVKNE